MIKNDDLLASARRLNARSVKQLSGPLKASHKQGLSLHLQEYSGHGSTRKYFLTGVSLAGIFCTMIELVSYALVFKHIAYHDNHVACHILQPEVIQRRNRSTTISMLGLLLCWLLDVFYISCTGLLFTLYDFGRLRELASLLKTVDFVLVPWIQTLTTPPIRKFIQRSGVKIA